MWILLIAIAPQTQTPALPALAFDRFPAEARSMPSRHPDSFLLVIFGNPSVRP